MLRVLHGSRLYGLTKPNSDWDFIEVYADQRKSRTILKYGFDVRQYSLSNFTRFADKGHPFFLEAMFAPEQFVSFDRIQQFRKNYRGNAAKAHSSYESVIRSFEELDSAKGKRNIIRLNRDYETLSKHGRFDPSVHSDLRGI